MMLRKRRWPGTVLVVFAVMAALAGVVALSSTWNTTWRWRFENDLARHFRFGTHVERDGWRIVALEAHLQANSLAEARARIEEAGFTCSETADGLACSRTVNLSWFCDEKWLIDAEAENPGQGVRLSGKIGSVCV